MRIQLIHVTRYDYQRPARSILQLLRLTPRPNDGQRVVNWRVELDVDASLRRGEDALGNVTHTAFAAGPVTSVAITVRGEVETSDSHGVVRGGLERFAPEVFLRQTPLTVADPELKAFARDQTEPAGEDLLGRLHRLMAALHQAVAFDTRPTTTTTPAAAAFALRRGVCQDHSHIFIAAARSLGIPARYVSGHLARSDGVQEQDASHAWAEAHVPDLGWVGFDPTNGISVTDAYIRVAIGLDYLGAAPVRGSRTGGGEETLDVKLRVVHAAAQQQS